MVFASFDNRKRDDFKPYILKSTDKGKTWAPISNNLPDNGTVHTIEQDFIQPELLFVGTEFGVFYSMDGGKEWVKFTSGLPTISVRDLTIQKRESDLAIATFGRGFYILDDYSPMRSFRPEILDSEAHIFPVKDALAYIQTGDIYGQGSHRYLGKNPEFGATFTYYLKESPKTRKEVRQELEEKQFEKSEKIKVLNWNEVREEGKEEKPHLIFTIYDANNNILKVLRTSASKGIKRFTWNLSYGSPMPVRMGEEFNPLAKVQDGFLVMPGTYKVGLSKSIDGQVSNLTDPVEFKVNALKNTSLPAPDRKELVEFQLKLSNLAGKMTGVMRYSSELSKQTSSILQTLYQWPGATPKLIERTKKVKESLDEIDFSFNGHRAKASWEEVPPGPMPLSNRLNSIVYAHYMSTSEITKTEKDGYSILMEKFPPVLEKLKATAEELKLIQKELTKLGAPWTQGRFPEL